MQISLSKKSLYNAKYLPDVMKSMSMVPTTQSISNAPVILHKNIRDYLAQNSFDLYIVNEFSRFLVAGSDHVLIIEQSDIKKLDVFLKNFTGVGKRVLAIGAGAVIDAAKYICLKTQSDFYCAPSALSTNSFVTHRNSFFDPAIGKNSFNSVTAKQLIVDYELIRTAPILNLFGIVEVAATTIALVDCRITSDRIGTMFDTELLRRAERMVDAITPILSGDVDESNLDVLLGALVESGYLTRQYGSGRIVSGSEHIVSSYLENDFSCPHGVGLLFGILICSELQKNHGYADERVEDVSVALMHNTHMRNFIWKNYPPEKVIQTLERVRPRVDKVTILDITAHNEFAMVSAREVKRYYQY